MVAVLQAEERTNFRKSTLKKLRKEGNVPAVIYGKNMDTLSISVNRPELIKQIRKVGRNGVLSIQFNDKKQNAILRSYQEDPITKDIIHLDFLAVDASSEISANVRIDLLGDAQGVKDGGVLQQSLFELSLTAKVDDIPEVIEMDISDLKVAETITVGEVKQKYNYHFDHEDDEVIASILPPKQEEEISTGEEQEPGIPENLEGREESPKE